MVGSMRRKDLVRIPGATRVATTSSIVVAALCVWGVTPGPNLVVSLLPALVAVPLAVRSLFLGVFVGPSGLLVRSWFRSYRFERDEIVSVGKFNYDGAFSVGGATAFLLILVVETSEDGRPRRRELQVTAGTPRRVGDRLEHIRRVLTPNPAARPRP